MDKLHFAYLFFLVIWREELRCQSYELKEDNFKEPFILRRSRVVEKWELFAKDAETSIWSLVPKVLNHTYISDQPTFPYYDRAIIKDMKDFPAEYSFQKSTVESFFVPNEKLAVDSPEHTLYSYYSGNIMQKEFDIIRNKMKVSELFENIATLPQLTGNIWLSNRLVHATLHYDAVYNLFLQLEGRKKVIIRPPIDILPSAIYGRNHPNACQSRWEDSSQRRSFISRPLYSIKQQHILNESVSSCQGNNISDVWSSATSHKSFSSLDYPSDYLEIILEPMDILFIPPFWLHETVALDSSVSLSFWWETDLMMQFQDWLASPLPIEENWSGKRIQRVVNQYLLYLVEGLAIGLSDSHYTLAISQDDVKTLIKQLLALRYIEDVDCRYTIHSSEDLNPHDDDDLDDLEADAFLTRKLKRYAKTLTKTIINQFHARMKESRNHPKILSDQAMREVTKIESWEGKWINRSRSNLCREQGTADADAHCQLSDFEKGKDSSSKEILSKDFNRKNEVMMLLTKVNDYIEEVFTFIAQYLIETKADLYSHHSKV